LDDLLGSQVQKLFFLVCLLFTAKTGCDAIKNKRHLQTLESIPKFAVGRLKKPSGYLVDTPRSSQDKQKTEETHKTRTPKNKDKSSPILI